MFATTTVFVPVEPKVVMFCQIKYHNTYNFTVEEPSYMMLMLTALKRLNFRVHAPTFNATNPGVVYLCEHMGEGVDYDIVQNALKGICQSTLKPLTSRSFKSTDNQYYIQWVYG
jgi:hypothetical protein